MMSSNRTEIGAAWIVALALIALMVVHAFLPQTPPRLAHGVSDVSSVRVGQSLQNLPAKPSETDVPLIEYGDPFGVDFGNRPATTPRTPSGSDLGARADRTHG